MIQCCISQMARWGLSRLKEKKQRENRQELDIDRALKNVVEFKDSCVSTDHPHVDSVLLQRLHQINPHLILCWELQFYFEHRWHVKLMDQGEMKSVLLLQDPPYPIKASQHSAEYLPFDSRALWIVSRLMHQFRHGLQVEVVEQHIKKMYHQHEMQLKAREQVAADMDNDLKSVNRRLTGQQNISDPGWERGIGFTDEGTPYIDGKGAHTKEITRAI